MSALARVDRRALLGGGVAAVAASFALARRPALAQVDARVVVVGGGFAGATCARELRRAGIDAVTLVEPNQTYTACPMSNAVIVGMREMPAQRFGYDALRAEGIDVRHQNAVEIDAVGRRVALDDGSELRFDRLVLAPGIELRFDAVPGYDRDAAELMPHAWHAGPQTTLLRERLEAMPDGGLVVMTVPATPYRCPPGPYERASLIAHFLKTRKPRSKLLVLDAKDAFSKQKLFQAAWAELYPGLLEWVPQAGGGTVTAVDAKAGAVTTDFATHAAAVANVIPPQRSADIARRSGAADRTGWCPIDPVSLESRLLPGVHVIGDAAIAGAMPKSAFSANAQAKACAVAVAALLGGAPPPVPKLVNTCYSLVAPGYGISVAGVYAPANGLLADVPGAGGTSPLDASAEVRA
ncbi:MAG TPA: NAD(P)/FAD-dependent oxidoreductase, partial [Geminicoccaceae bacterium]